MPDGGVRCRRGRRSWRQLFGNKYRTEQALTSFPDKGNEQPGEEPETAGS